MKGSEKKYKLAELELKFAELVWLNEPIGSGELVRLCESTLNWKKSTTYTVLRKLCERGLFQNENATVTSIVKRDEFDRVKADKFVEETFEGSLPKFLTAFIGGKKLSPAQVDELKKLIDSHKETR